MKFRLYRVAQLCGASVLAGTFLCACNSGANDGGASDTTIEEALPTEPIVGSHIEAVSDGSKIKELKIFVGNSKFPASIQYLEPSVLTPESSHFVTYYFKDYAEYKGKRKYLSKKYKLIDGSLLGAESSPYNIPIGYSPSIDSILPSSAGGQCYTFESQPSLVPSLVVVQSDLSSVQTDQQFSGMTSSSVNLSVTYGLFKANAAATYGSNYSSSAQSGSFSLVGGLLGVLSTGATGSLSDNGLNLYNQSQSAFSQNCGTEVLSSYPVGYLEGLVINFDASNKEASSNFSATLGASYTLSSLNAAFSSEEKESSSISSVQMTRVAYGDATTYQTSLSVISTVSEDFANWISSSKISGVYAGCVSGQLADCASYASALSVFEQQELGFASNAIANSKQDNTLYATFPQGVNQLSAFIGYGSNTHTRPIQFPVQDQFASYAPELKNAVQLMFSLGALQGKLSVMQDNSQAPIVTSGVNNMYSSLRLAYAADYDSIKKAFQSCLNVESGAFSIATCNSSITIGGKNYTLKTLPSSVYELYSPSTTDLRSDALYWNALSLTYDGIYSEQGVGSQFTSGAPIQITNNMPISLLYVNGYNMAASLGWTSADTGFVLGLVGNPVLAAGSTNGANNGAKTDSDYAYPSAPFYVTLLNKSGTKNILTPGESFYANNSANINGFNKYLVDGNPLPDSSPSQALVSVAQSWEQPSSVNSNGSNLKLLSVYINSIYNKDGTDDWKPGTCSSGGAYIPYTTGSGQILTPLQYPYGSGTSSHDWSGSYKYALFCGQGSGALSYLNLSYGWSSQYSGYFSYGTNGSSQTVMTFTPHNEFFGF